MLTVKSRRNNARHLFIFDIDNTLADTFPTLNSKYASERDRLLSIVVFERMKSFVLKVMDNQDCKVVFLTSRSYKVWLLTHKWLAKNNIKVSVSDVVIVSSPLQKVEFIQKIANRKGGLTLVDDLSWNHENGEVKFYENEIQLISKLPIRYIGYRTIKRFNRK